MFLIMVKLLWGFEIEPAEGQGRIDDKAWTSGFLTKPLPFEAKFTVRSPRHGEVIRKGWQGCEKDVDALFNHVEEKRAGLR